MPIAKLRPGVGAQITILKSRVFPKSIVRNKYGQYDKNERLEGCILLKEGTKRTGKTMKEVYFLRHEDIENIELFACRRYCKITQEGAEADLFNAVTSDALVEQETQVCIPAVSGDISEDVERFLALGLMVDDDNMPAPENIPTNENTQNGEVQYNAWDSLVGCNRLMQGGNTEFQPSLMNEPREKGLAEWIMYWLPWDHIKDVVIPETNKRLEKPPLTEGEFLKYLGIWFLLSTVNTGVDKRSFWCKQDPNPFFGAPFRLTPYMTCNRFEKIGAALKYTDCYPPMYKDKCHEIRQMLNAFNDLMTRIFVPSCVVCLDESMSPWTNQFTCPAFVFCPRKPHPKGNEYHTIADGQSGILYRLEMVEGKDEPKELAETKKFKKFGKTPGLLLRLCETIFGSMRVVILDSGFCVLKGIIELKKKRCLFSCCY